MILCMNSAYKKCQNAIPLNTKKLIFQKGLMLIKQIYQKNVIFAAIGIFGCHDLMQKAVGFNNIAIVYIKGSADKIQFWYMSKDNAINIMNGSILHDKRVFIIYKK